MERRGVHPGRGRWAAPTPTCRASSCDRRRSRRRLLVRGHTTSGASGAHLQATHAGNPSQRRSASPVYSSHLDTTACSALLLLVLSLSLSQSLPSLRGQQRRRWAQRAYDWVGGIGVPVRHGQSWKGDLSEWAEKRSSAVARSLGRPEPQRSECSERSERSERFSALSPPSALLRISQPPLSSRAQSGLQRRQTPPTATARQRLGLPCALLSSRQLTSPQSSVHCCSVVLHSARRASPHASEGGVPSSVAPE